MNKIKRCPDKHNHLQHTITFIILTFPITLIVVPHALRGMKPMTWVLLECSLQAVLLGSFSRRWSSFSPLNAALSNSTVIEVSLQITWALAVEEIWSKLFLGYVKAYITIRHIKHKPKMSVLTLFNLHPNTSHFWVILLIAENDKELVTLNCICTIGTVKIDYCYIISNYCY